MLAKGHDVVVIDNLARGHKAAIDRIHGALEGEARKRLTFVQGDVGDRSAVAATLRSNGVEAVMHFAASAYVGESVTDPLAYHANNTGAAVELLRACHDAGVGRFIFSSTCATYGEPERVPIVETTPQAPVNPYGWSKLHFERALSDYAEACRIEGRDFAHAALRYFNVAGSDRSTVIGEWHQPETHLIPIVLEVAMGKREHVTIFGTDYATSDGTCVRDYIHVEDLVDAHEVVLRSLEAGDARRYNLGIGRGYSVREIIDTARAVTGREIRVVEGTRRAGDPPALVANASKIAEEIGWKAQITDLGAIIESAWKWYQANPDGYDRDPAASSAG